jgi:hypothetical protein
MNHHRSRLRRIVVILIIKIKIIRKPKQAVGRSGSLRSRVGPCLFRDCA